jgi:dipeptidyl aminopeptidase/acylaminoacyl peptidase
VKPTDLAHLAVPADPVLHPDGVRVAYVVRMPDVEDDRYDSVVRLWDGTTDHEFTHGPTDSMPRWSPDGRWLAFLRKAEGDEEKPQLLVMPADGGEGQVRTDLALGVSDLAWSPDSTKLVVVGSTWIDEVADLDDDERKRRPRRITRLPYRFDTEGWTHQRRAHLYLVDRDGQTEPQCLTPGEFDESSPVWRPDGQAIAFLSERHDDRGIRPGGQPFELDLASGEVRPLADVGSWSWVGYAPDGTIHLAGIPDVWDWPGISRLFRRDDDGDLTDLTGHVDRDVAMTAGVAPAGPRFVDGGFLIALEDRGTVQVARFDDDGQVARVVSGNRVVTGFDTDGIAVAFTATEPSTPGELYVLRDGSEQQVTWLGEAFRDEVDVRPTTAFTFERDGAELDVWAVTPDGFDDAAPASVPVLLNIHGGPTAQYGWTFFDEFQVYAGAGYLVVATNPRGSSGRGEEWARAVVGAWDDPESVDMLDLRAVVDATLERYPQADPDRVGIMGGSYGGYATARIIATDDRFRSAIVERGLLNWPSFGGTSDIGPYFDRMFLGVHLDPDEPGGIHHLASPLRLVGGVTTPTLVLHSEHDWRCPIEQAEQYFVGLQRAGVPSEFVRFPSEGHELSRSGSPKHRVERFEVVLDWHARHLKGPGT